MDLTLLGYAAAICTTGAFVPQVLHTLKTKDTRSISLGMYSIFVLGVALWFTYGIVVMDVPLLLANFVTLLLSASILFLKIKDTLRGE